MSTSLIKIVYAEIYQNNLIKSIRKAIEINSQLIFAQKCIFLRISIDKYLKKVVQYLFSVEKQF